MVVAEKAEKEQDKEFVEISQYPHSQRRRRNGQEESRSQTKLVY